MTNHTLTDHRLASAPASRRVRPRLLVLVAAVAFVAFYLATDLVAPNLASSALPRPDDPVREVRDWYADNQLAAVMIGISQFVSVCFLGAFALLLPRAALTGAQRGALRRARAWGLVAMALMMVSSVAGWLLAGFAADAQLGEVSALRGTSFVAGGTAHVAALGVFVWLAARAPGFGTAVRRLAVTALVVALLSLLALVVTFGAVFILLGRLLCMIWAVSAAVSIIRGHRTGRW